MPATAIDLSQLPPPNVLEALGYETALAALTADAVSRMPAALQAEFAATLQLESEPALKILQSIAYLDTLLRNRVNQAARGNMLATAEEADLDNLAANLDVQRLDGESDDDLRARCALAPEGWSVAGPQLAYVFRAKGASPLVADVAVSSPGPGQVRVSILSTAATGVADAGLLAAVAGAVNASEVRPLTDQVSVVSASIALYDVTAVLHLAGGLDAATVIAAATVAVQAYAAARRKQGSGVAVKLLDGALGQPGVENIERTAPAADIPAVPETAPVLRTLTITAVVGGAGV